MTYHLRRLCILLILFAVYPVLAQEQIELRIGQVNVSQFPTVRFNLFSADSRRVPLAISEIQNMSLREGGVPIADFELTAVPVGVDIVFVLDANGDYRAVDLSGLTREEVATEAVTRFAERVMSPSGLDRVSIVVADESNENGRFLVQDNSNPESVSQAITSYNPPANAPVPLDSMMTMAIEHMADIQENGRFQALLLLSDAGRIHGQLEYETVITQAQAIDLPLYVGILGTGASSDETGNAAGLAGPTRADYLHIPDAAEIDPIYLIWQRQANQVQVTYHSLLRASGSYPISVNVGTLLANSTVELTLEPPEVSLELESEMVRRLGDAPDTPLAELEPAQLTIPVIVRWPDGLPRQITAVNWFVDGQPQPLPDLPNFDEDGRIQLNWPMPTADTGSYQHQVQVVDELGLVGDSGPVIVMVEVERPLPPPPTPLPTVVPETAEVPATVGASNMLLLMAIVGVVASSLLVLRLRRRRRHKGPAIQPKRRQKQVARPGEPVAVPDQDGLLPFLEIIDARPGTIARIPIHGDTITIGRDETVAQVVFNDSSVSRLHARIRHRDDTYWLYDEGSTSGTSLNYERLGLAPRLLNDNDAIQIGRISLRFRLSTLTKPDGKKEVIE